MTREELIVKYTRLANDTTQGDHTRLTAAFVADRLKEDHPIEFLQEAFMSMAEALERANEWDGATVMAYITIDLLELHPEEGQTVGEMAVMRVQAAHLERMSGIRFPE